MANREDGYGFFVFDFKKRDIAAATERNHQLTQKRVVGGRLAAGKGKIAQEGDALFDGFEGAARGSRVFPQKEIVQPQKIFPGGPGVTDGKAHLRASASLRASISRMLAKTSSAE